MRKVIFSIIALLLIALVARIAWLKIPSQTVLPNGFIIQGRSTVLSADGRTTLSDDADFICFDDRFIFIHPGSYGRSGLFDAQTQQQVRVEDHPELRGPNGMLIGGQACNGYYTAIIGPGLLHDNGRFPFLPRCSSVNRTNPTLQNRAWLERPCADRSGD